MDLSNYELLRAPNTYKSNNLHNRHIMRSSNLAVLAAKLTELVGSPQRLYGCL